MRVSGSNGCLAVCNILLQHGALNTDNAALALSDLLHCGSPATGLFPICSPPVCSNWQPLRAGVDRLVQRGKPVLLWCLTSLETVSPEWFHAAAAEVPIPLRFRPLRDSDGLKAHRLLHPQVEHSVITGASCLGSYWQMLSINPADISIPTSCRPCTTCLNPWPVFSRSVRQVDTQLFDVPLDPELLNIAHVLVLTLSLCCTGVVQFWECERIVRML